MPALRLLSALLTIGVLGAAPSAQDHRLSWTVRAPLVYLKAEAPAASQAVPVEDLLADPALASVLGLDAPGGHALDALRGVLAAGTRNNAALAVELALTGLQRRAGGDVPRLVFRAQLVAEAAARMRAVLADRRMFTPRREIAGHGVLQVNGRDGDPPIEVALVDDELIASNSGAVMDRVVGGDELGDERDERHPVLAASPAFRSLREQVELGPGCVLVFADVKSLRAKLVAGSRADVLSGLSCPVTTERLLCVLRPDKSGVRTTLLLQHDGHGGWLSSTEPVRADTLAASLPGAGLGGAAIAVDPALLSRSAGTRPRGAASGLSALRMVMGDELGGPAGSPHRTARSLSGSLAIGLIEGDAGVQPLFALRARTSAAARHLFSLVRDRLLPENRAQGSRAPDRITLRASGVSFQFGVAASSLVLAPDGVDLDSAAPALTRSRGDRRQSLFGALRRLGADQRAVNGIFDLDLSASSEAKPERSFLMRRHVGLLTARPGVIRIEALTEIR